MTKRFNYRCHECRNETFTAHGIANDMPIGDSDDECKFSLIFTCDNCFNEVTTISTHMDQSINFKMDFSP